jgi:hypothetical protein
LEPPGINTKYEKRIFYKDCPGAIKPKALKTSSVPKSKINPGRQETKQAYI